MMNLLRLIGGRFRACCTGTVADSFCAVGLICWECCGQRSLLWYRGILCSIRKRSSSGWTAASMSRRISCGRCYMIADSDSDIPGPGFSSERTVVRRRPVKSLDLGPASPVY